MRLWKGPKPRNPVVADAVKFLDSKQFKRWSYIDLNNKRHLKYLTHRHETRFIGPPRVWMDRTSDEGAKRVGLLYCEELWRSGVIDQVLQHPSTRSTFHVALSVDHRSGYEAITKRSALITDTLLLSDDTFEGHTAEAAPRAPGDFGPDLLRVLSEIVKDYPPPTSGRPWRLHSREISVLYRTPVLLGRWLGGAKPLVSSGAVWFLPHYYVSHIFPGSYADSSVAFEPTRPLDFLIRAGRAVEMSGAHPVKSRLVRPIIELEIPVIEGTTLRDFSDITAGEFNSYAAFRDFLRARMLDLDPAMSAVDSQTALTKIGLEISDQMRGMNAQLRQVRTKRAVQVTGAAIGTVGAVLLGVYGPALQSVITALGASAGLWGGVTALAENSTRPLRDDKWYYVWALAKKAELL